MVVFDHDNQYGFANTVISLVDNTIVRDDTQYPVPPTPKFNFLIPTVQAVGITNTVELFYPGEPNRYLIAHGTPNAVKYGFGPDLIHEILKRGADNVGVYTVNLRGESATHANVILKCLYKVEEAVPYTSESGDPYYVTPDGELTTEPTGNTAVVRDVLHLKFELDYATNVKSWVDLHGYFNGLYSKTPDADGYCCIPVFALMYMGSSEYGNESYFSMVPQIAEYDGNIYYQVKLFDGASSTTTGATFAMDPTAGTKYGQNYFVENQFSTNFPNYRFMAGENYDELISLVNAHAFTIEDVINGNTTPSEGIDQIDIFDANRFCIVNDGDFDTTRPTAFQFKNGSDGDETPDELFEKFFHGDIIPDVASVLRYQFNYIPDVGYNDATKAEIVNLVEARNRMTVATIMLGDTSSFRSALLDHQSNFYKTMPCIRQIAAVQSPMRFNENCRHTLVHPAGYYDSLALVDHFITKGFYDPFAGADARWTGFIDDTLQCPSETAEFLNSIYTNRINAVMRDSQTGAYLNDQLMNTQLVSDQTELNNAFLISSMLYDLVQLIHINHFKFNEPSDVQNFQTAVDDTINATYAKYSASLTTEVYRLGTVGRAKQTNKVVVTVNMRDINRYAKVELILNDE